MALSGPNRPMCCTRGENLGTVHAQPTARALAPPLESAGTPLRDARRSLPMPPGTALDDPWRARQRESDARGEAKADRLSKGEEATTSH